MRKLNMFLVIGMLVTFLAHAIAGSLQLAGAQVNTLTGFGWVSVGLICAHIVVTTILSIDTLKSIKASGASYFKDNKLFWVRRISGFTIVIPLLMHLLIFKSSNADAFRLTVFTRGRMISQILLVVCIAVHALTNIKPLLISLGIKSYKESFVDALLILSSCLLLFAVAFVIYYLRWMRN